MKNRYSYESFSSSLSAFDQGFSNFLNEKYTDDWKVKDCTFHQEGDHKTASCLFKRR
jgi:hypothetical protein